MAASFLLNLVICACIYATITATSATSPLAAVDRTKKSVGPYLNGYNGHEYDNGQYHSNLYHNPLYNTGKYDPLFDNSQYYIPATAAAYNAKYNYNGQYYNPYVNSAVYNPLYNPYSVHNLKYNPYIPNSYLGQKVIGANYQAAYPGASFAYQSAYPGAYLDPRYSGAYTDTRYHGAYPYGRIIPTSAYINAQRYGSDNKASSTTSQSKATGQKHGY